MCVCVCVCVCVNMSVGDATRGVSKGVCVCMCVCVSGGCVCACVWTHRKVGGSVDREQSKGCDTDVLAS